MKFLWEREFCLHEVFGHKRIFCLQWSFCKRESFVCKAFVCICVCVERERERGRERKRESSWLLCSTHFLVFCDVPVFVLHVRGSLQEPVWTVVKGREFRLHNFAVQGIATGNWISCSYEFCCCSWRKLLHVMEIMQGAAAGRALPELNHLLQHTLRSLCTDSQWVYAVFWRILPRNYPPPQ